VDKPYDPQEELFRIVEKYKLDVAKKETEEGSVTNSLGMLTSIPEVDLGMEYVLSFSFFLLPPSLFLLPSIFQLRPFSSHLKPIRSDWVAISLETWERN
jgi:hypothetical protein